MTFKKPYLPEVRERAVRMVFETQDDHDTQWAAIRSIAEKFGCSGVGAAQLGAPSRGRCRHPAWPDQQRA